AGGDAEGIVALGAHPPGLLDLDPVHDLLARLALDPQPLGDDDLLRRPLGLLLRPLEPGGHQLVLSGAFSEAMKSPTLSTRAEVPACSSIVRTMAEPTATPSATRPTT